MLTYDIHQKGNIPIYDFIYQSIKEDILSGKLQPDEKLPSKRSFAKHLNIGVITVENAYEQLLVEGYIYSVEKKGYYVEPLTRLPEKKNNLISSEKPESKEHEYYADFKANRISHKMFPKATWAKLLRQVLSSDDDQLLKTVPYNGLYQLRKAIADYLLQDRGIKTTPQQIIVGAGTEYLYSRLLQLFGRDSVIALEDPGYWKFAEIAHNYGVKTEFVRTDDFGMSIRELEKSSANIVHISPSNHFPTGTLMPISRRQEIVAWAAKEPDRYIIEDDYDSELRYAGRMIPPMVSVDAPQGIIYMNTFSKSLVPSLRISYMVLPEGLMQRYKETLSFYSSTVSSYEQYTLALFMSKGYFERHINRMKNYYRGIRKTLLNEIARSRLSEIVRVEERKAGTHFLLVVDTKMSKDEIYQAAEREDIYISLLSEYCKTPIDVMDRTLIINYAGMEEDKIPEAVERIYRIFR